MNLRTSQTLFTGTIGKIQLPYPNSTYEGEISNGEANGYGIQIRDGQVVYRGEWKNNKWHGWGRSYWLLEKTLNYEGEWRENKYHGFGREYDLNGYLSFEGTWIDDKLHGYIKIYDDGKLMFEGEYVHGERHGFGKCIDPDGLVSASGSFSNGSIQGNGYFYGYECVFKDKTLRFPSFKDGFNKISTSGKVAFECNWENGLADGLGKYTDRHGETYVGTWKNGIRTGIFEWYLPSGELGGTIDYSKKTFYGGL